MPTVQLDRDSLITREQAADLLGLRPQTLAAWATTGRGPAIVRLGRAVRYRVSELTRYVESQTERHSAAAE